MSRSGKARVSHRLAPERGSVTLAAIVLGCALAVGLLVGSLVLAHVLAVHEARSGADLAALAAATDAVRLHDEDSACAAASRSMSSSRDQVTACEVVQAGYEVAARVEVTVDLAWTLPGLPQTVSAVSYAGNPS